jgi:hypothetical protein
MSWSQLDSLERSDWLHLPSYQVRQLLLELLDPLLEIRAEWPHANNARRLLGSCLLFLLLVILDAIFLRGLLIGIALRFLFLASPIRLVFLHSLVYQLLIINPQFSILGIFSGLIANYNHGFCSEFSCGSFVGLYSQGRSLDL